MVDINLFDDDAEEAGKKEKEWDSPPGKKEGPGSEALKDELSLDDELGSPGALGDDKLFGDEESIPDLEESESQGGNEEFGYRDSKKKKTPIVYYIILLGVVIAAVVYVYFFVLHRGPRSRTVSPTATVKQPVLGRDGSTPGQPAALPGTGSPAGGRTDTRASTADSLRRLTAVGTETSLIDVTKIVLDDLSRAEQFGAVLLDGNWFAVEYVSSVSGVVQQMGGRIQSLLDASAFKASPEERHRIGSKVTYWGVISGTIGKRFALRPEPTSVRFTSAEQFTEQLRTLARQNRMNVVDIRKQYLPGAESARQVAFRLKAEGGRPDAVAWLDQIKKLQANCRIRTLFLVPVEYFDQKAGRVKVVLDVTAAIG